jgi:alpha-aminoadipic semialdehyde synthase
MAAIVQPYPQRVFSDEEYLGAGARVEEALDEADVLFAVKEIPTHLFLPGRAYAFFSHTVKKQLHNMPMLKRLLELGCTLVDYERIADDQGRRLVFFSRQAGQAGMIDSLHLLGRRLSHEGYSTAFADVGMAHEYEDLGATRRAFGRVGQRLQDEGTPPELSPLVVGFAGYGNVSLGAQEVFGYLPHSVCSPEDLLASRVPRTHPLVKVVFREEHLVERLGGGAFELPRYYAHPEEYRGVFARFLPRLHLLVNGIYWDERYPRLVTFEDLRQLWSGATPPALRVIGDVSCDLGGSIQCTVKATKPDEPSYVVHPEDGRISMGVEGRGPVILAVDNLPAELSRESSLFFSEQLRPFVGPLTTADRSVPFDRYVLPAPLRRAVIAYNGELTPDYQYIAEAL